MKNTKPLKDFIAELQALENANPGIVCVVDDEWGPSEPKAELLKMYINEHSQNILVDAFTFNHVQGMEKEYRENGLQDMWEKIGGANNGEYATIEDYEKDYTLVKTNVQKEFEMIATAVPVVVINS